MEKAIIKAFLKEKKDYGDKLTDEEQGMLEGDPDMKNRVTDPETMDTFKKRESTRSGHKDNIETVTPHHGKLEAEYDRIRSGSKFHPTTIGGHKVGQKEERDIPLPRVAGTALDPESARHGTSGLGDERQTLGFMVADHAGERGDMTPEEQDEYRQSAHEMSHRMTMDKELAEKLRGKAEEGPGGMQMGAQRGLGHEAGYTQGSGESTQVTEVEEKNVEKNGKNIHGFPHGKCVRCGHYMESEEYQTAEHSFNNPKEGEKVCNDCFDQEQGEDMGEESKVFGKQSDSTISHTDPKKKEKSAYENHEQDESPDSQPNKQQIPSSKVGMDAIKSRVNLIKIKYKNIYKLANL